MFVRCSPLRPIMVCHLDMVVGLSTPWTWKILNLKERKEVNYEPTKCLIKQTYCTLSVLVILGFKAEFGFILWLLVDIGDAHWTKLVQLQHWTIAHLEHKIKNIYVKNCSVYIQCKGDIVVVDIKQHKSQFKEFKLYHYTVSKVLLTLCNGDVWIF